MIDLNADVFMVRSRIKNVFSVLPGVVGWSISDVTISIFVDSDESELLFPKEFDNRKIIIVHVTERLM